MHCVVHMQLGSQGEVLPLSPTLKDGSSLLTIKPATVECVLECLRTKALLTQPNRLGSLAVKAAYRSVPCIPF